MARNKKQLPLLEKVTITDVAAEGKAIARVNDMVVFVPFVAPGDVIDIQLTRKKHSYAEGKAVLFHEYSPQRAGYTLPNLFIFVTPLNINNLLGLLLYKVSLKTSFTLSLLTN